MRCLRPAAVSLLLLFALAPTAAAAAAPEAKRMLTNVRGVERAAQTHAKEILAAVDRFGERTKPCADKIEQDTREAQSAFGIVYVLDLGQVYTAPLRREIRVAAKRFATMSLRDTRLKALARLLGRQANALVSIPELDTCALMEQWRSTGFTEETAPQAVRDGKAAIFPKGADRTLLRGRARLIRQGLTRSQATRVVDFPLS